jgi:hypothetical protein
MKGRSLLPACALGVLVSCGGGKQEPSKAPPAVVEAPRVEVLPPLAKVAPPAELFAVARVPNTAKTADTGVAWSGLPMNWRSLLDKAVPGLSQAAVFDAPLDFAAMLDPTSVEAPRVLWAFSVGAPSTDIAAAFFRSQGARVTQEAAGAYRVKLGNGLSCMLVRALGAAPARAVCSDDAVNADALAPYMSCGMPTESFGQGELHAHVTADPFRRRYGSQVTLVRTVGVPFLLRELSLDQPKFDRALRDVLYGLADEVIALSYDLERVDFDATLATGGNELDVSTTISMMGQRSWLAETAVKAAGRGSPAPDVFWKLSGDVLSASYSAVPDPDRFRGPAAALRELADGWLDYHKLPAPRRTPLVEALEQIMTTSAAAAYATVPDEASLPPAEYGKATTVESVKASIGENLFVVDQGGDRFVRFASELVKALGDAGFRKHLAQSNVLEAKEIPTGKERAPKFAKGLAPKTRVFEVTIPLSALESASRMAKARRGQKALPPPHPAKPGEAVNVVFVAMPDGPVTWFAFGTDEKLLETRLADVKAGTAPTLAARPGLAALKTESAVSAGFSSLAALVEGIRNSLGGKDAPSIKSLSMLPHRGEVPLLWRGTADATGPKLVGTARLPRELVEDLVAMAAASAATNLKK